MTSLVSTKTIVVSTIAATAFAIYQVAAIRSDWKAAREAVKAERDERRARRARLARIIGSVVIAGCIAGSYFKLKSIVKSTSSALAATTTAPGRNPTRKMA